MSHPIRGKTIQWSFSDGQVAGMTFEHRFHVDGTVDYSIVGKDSGKKGPGVPYICQKLNDDVYCVSYVSKEGWLLAVCLDLASGKLVSVASDGKDHQPQEGTFTIMTRGGHATA